MTNFGYIRDLPTPIPDEAIEARVAAVCAISGLSILDHEQDIAI